MSFSKFCFSVCCCAFMLAFSANAVPLYWDSDGVAGGNDIASGSGLGGSGTWDTSSSFWFNGTSDVPWSNANLDDAVLTGSPGTITLGGNISLKSLSFTNTSGFTISGGTLNGETNAVTIDTGGADYAINSVIDGNGLIKLGAGALTIGSVNIFSNATTISGGTLRLGAADLIPDSSGVSISAGAALDLNNFNETIGSLSSTGNVIMNGNLAVGANNTGSTFSGTISGSGSLIKVGTANFTLNGTNTYSGNTIVGNGKLFVGTDANLGAVPGSTLADSIQFTNNGILRATTNFTLNSARGITLVGDGTLEPATGVTLTYSGVITGSGALNKTGNGTLRLTGTSTFTGPLNIKDGVLSIDTSTRIPAGSATVSIDNGTFRNSSYAPSSATLLNASHPIVIGTNGGTINLNGNTGGTNTILLYSGVINGPGVLTKTGAGELRVYTQTNTFNKLVISAGIFTVGQSTATTFDENFGAVPESFLPDAITIQSGATNRLAGGNNLTLHTNRGITIGSGGGTFYGNSGVNLTIPAPVSGSNLLSKVGSYTLTLSGDNTNFTGKMLVLAGALSVNSDIALGAAPPNFLSDAITLAGGTLKMTTTTTLNTNRGITLTNNSTIDVSSSKTLTFNGSIEGFGTNNLTKITAGTLRLGGSGTNTYKDFILSGGTLSVDRDNALGVGILDIASDGVTLRAANVTARSLTNAIKLTATNFVLSGSDSLFLSGDVNVINSPTGVTNSNSQPTYFLGALTNSGGLRLEATAQNTIILTGNNTYSGGTAVNGGKLFVSSGTGSGAITVNTNGTFGGSGTIAGAVTMNGGILAPGGHATTNAVGKLTLQNGLTMSGATNLWDLGALADNTSGAAGVDFDQVNVTGGLVNLSASILSLGFTNASLAPDFATPFWQTAHKWTVVNVSAPSLNPTLTGFSSVQTNTFYYAGSFSTGVELDGRVSLSFTPAGPTAPIILTQPQSKTGAQGSNVTFSVAATGTAALTYQWYAGGSLIAGATSNSLALTNVQTANEGTYYVHVHNGSGDADSTNVTLTVIIPPTITLQPLGRNVEVGSNVTFTVQATGTAPILYQWKFNGTNIGGATDTNYVIGSAQTTDSGTYTVVASNAASSVTSSNAVLTVGSVPAPILSLALSNNLAILSWTSVSAKIYRPQFSANLTDWTNIPPDITAIGSNTSLTNDVTGVKSRSYRVLLLP